MPDQEATVSDLIAEARRRKMKLPAEIEQAAPQQQGGGIGGVLGGALKGLASARGVALPESQTDVFQSALVKGIGQQQAKSLFPSTTVSEDAKLLEQQGFFNTLEEAKKTAEASGLEIGSAKRVGNQFQVTFNRPKGPLVTIGGFDPAQFNADQEDNFVEEEPQQFTGQIQASQKQQSAIQPAPQQKLPFELPESLEIAEQEAEEAIASGKDPELVQQRLVQIREAMGSQGPTTKMDFTPMATRMGIDPQVISSIQSQTMVEDEQLAKILRDLERGEL